MNPALEQEIIDACTAVEMGRESAKNGDSVMMVTALKDVRKRINGCSRQRTSICWR